MTATSIPASSIARWKPKLVITVTTTPPSSSPRRGHAAGGQGDQLVAVVDAAVAVDRQHPVAVAVEGEADLGLGAGDALGQRLEVGGAAAGVDVAPVGLDADRLDLGAEALEDRRRGAVGGAVGAVEDDAAAGEVEREGRLELAQVVVEAAVQLAHAADLASAAGVASSSDSIRASSSSPSFVPWPEKNLMPLSR